ncbi:MAG: hypothetical protein ACK46W_04060 [Bacteroidota bacterium]
MHFYINAFIDTCDFYLGDAFGPGYSGLAKARFLLRKEPSPAYPYRDNFMLKFYVGDAFIVKIIRARPYGSGFYGLRYASEHPADCSPSGPANPSRKYSKCNYFGIVKKP